MQPSSSNLDRLLAERPYRAKMIEYWGPLLSEVGQPEASRQADNPVTAGELTREGCPT